MRGCARGCVVAVVVAAVVVGVAAYLVVSRFNRWRAPSEVLRPDRTAADGSLRFDLTGWQCNITVPQHPPGGQWCLAHVTVHNTGGKDVYYRDGYQYAFAGTTGYRGDLGIPADQTLSPGQSVNADLYFDIPRGAAPDHLELHDGWLSGGVKVALPSPPWQR